MITVTVYCSHCGSEDVVRNGRAPNGKQKYRCRACKQQSRENPTSNAYPEERREEILDFIPIEEWEAKDQDERESYVRHSKFPWLDHDNLDTRDGRHL